MAITEGQKLPAAKMLVMGPNGPTSFDLTERLSGRKIVLFGLPGAYTGTCSTVHLPSFIRTADKIRANGVDEIICVSVNDPFVLKEWAESTGAAKAGIAIVGDSDGSFTRELGMAFDAPQIGLLGRSSRYVAVVEDGVVTHVQIDKPGECNVSTGEAVLEVLSA